MANLLLAYPHLKFVKLSGGKNPDVYLYKEEFKKLFAEYDIFLAITKKA